MFLFLNSELVQVRGSIYIIWIEQNLLALTYAISAIVWRMLI